MKQKMTGITTKLMRVFGIIFILAMIISCGLNSWNLHDNLVEAVEERLDDNAGNLSELVNSKLEDRITMLESVARREEITSLEAGSTELNEALDLEAQILGFRNIFFADLNGTMTITSGAGIDVSTDPIFIAAMTGESTYSDPTVDSGTVLVNVAVPVTDSNGTIIGALIGTQDIEDFSSYIIEEGRTSFMINSAGDYIAHSESSLINQGDSEEESESTSQYDEKNQSIINDMVSGNSSFGEYTLETTGDTYYIAYAQVACTGWSIAVLENKDTIQNGILVQMGSNVTVSIFFVIVGIFAFAVFCKKIVNGIKGITEHLNILAQGDFKTPVDAKLMKLNDEIGVASRATEQMRVAISEVIGVLKASAQTMNQRSAELRDVSSSVQVNAQGIASSTHEMAVGVQDQSNDLVDILDIINDFGKLIENAIAKITKIQEKTENVNNEVTEGDANAKELNHSVQDVSESFNEFAHKIELLSSNIQEISNITSLINGVADQTNLLALNASIEAARAGEAGKGFAVVADEIRKLAEECKNSADEINKMITTIASDADTIIAGSVSLNEDMNGQMTIINQTANSYEAMSDAIYEMIDHITEVSTIAGNLGKSKDEIISRVENSTAVGEEITASTEEISASAECMKSSADSVEEAAGNLSNIAVEIDTQVKKFAV